MCTKCGINQVVDRFIIDKELGYCGDCADILRLGETKEARKMEATAQAKAAAADGVAAEAPGVEPDEDEDEDDDGAAVDVD
jgi:hypothetical protein